MKEEKSKTNGLKPSVELLRLNEQREQMPEGSAGLHLEIEYDYSEFRLYSLYMFSQQQKAGIQKATIP